ncbi:MAG: YfiM family protein [Ignavibacteria bacterium]|nr:YfiM family protein [Ignavibacteria bacterium]
MKTFIVWVSLIGVLFINSNVFSFSKINKVSPNVRLSLTNPDNVLSISNVRLSLSKPDNVFSIRDVRLSLTNPDQLVLAESEKSSFDRLRVTPVNEFGMAQDFVLHQPNDTIKSNDVYYIFKYKELQSIQPVNYNLKTKIYFDRLLLVTALTSASVAVVHHHQSKAWWQGTRTKFHFQNDWEYALWIDKLGHWWGATAIQHLFSSSLSWSNFSDETSMWLGSILALTYQLYVETYDGYAKDWGFSPGDAMFDFGGAFYPLLQYYIPPLKNVNLKLSYYPSKRLLKKDPNDELYRNKFVIDDYEGQSFYLSFKINNMLPENLEKYWPDFLCLAIGYQMRNWNGYAVADQNYFLTLDYDFEQIPLYGQFWQFLKNTFNLIHFPAPGINFSKKKIYLTITY